MLFLPDPLRRGALLPLRFFIVLLAPLRTPVCVSAPFCEAVLPLAARAKMYNTVQYAVCFGVQGALVLPLQFRSLNSLSWLGGSSALAIVVAMGLIFADIIEQDVMSKSNATHSHPPSLPHTSMGPPSNNDFLTVSLPS